MALNAPIASGGEVVVAEKEATEGESFTLNENVAVETSATTVEQPVAPTEEITLFSMVRNLNENFKKAKKQEKEKIKLNEPLVAAEVKQEIKVETVEVPVAAAAASECKIQVKEEPRKAKAAKLSSGCSPNTSIKPQRGAAEKVSTKLVQKNQKIPPLKRLSARSDTASETNNDEPDEDENGNFNLINSFVN